MLLLIKYIILALLWLIYGFIHSLFAAQWVKDLYNRIFPSYRNFYRLIYVGFASLGIGIIVWYMSLLPQKFIFYQTAFTVFTGLTLTTAGLLFVFIAFQSYDLKEFLGMRQLAGIHDPGIFIQEGPLAFVRHPLYTGSVIAMIGYILFAPTVTLVITLVCLTIYFRIGIYFEEKKLIDDFGETYMEYKNNVPALIPSLKIFNYLFKKPKKS